MAALEVLGSVGTRHLLQKTSDTWPPLIRALDAPDARVQFAAASAIMQLDPASRFGRSERVVEIFARELAGTSQPQSVIIDPNVDRASIVASLVGAIGFDASIAGTGQEGFERAVSQPIGLAVVHLNSIRWELSQTVANFRADARTRNVPIAIYGPAGMQNSVRELLTAQPVVYIEEANDTRDLSRTLRPLLAQITPPPLNQQQRDAQRKAAAYWLRHIAQGHRTQVFDLRPAEAALAGVVNEPELASDVLIALGGVPTASAQESLAEAVTAPGFDLAIRETAALQLAFHIQRFGVLVQNGTLSELKQTFEQATEPAMQTALASVIGSLKPADELLSRTLRDYRSRRPWTDGRDGEGGVDHRDGGFAAELLADRQRGAPGLCDARVDGRRLEPGLVAQHRDDEQRLSGRIQDRLRNEGLQLVPFRERHG